jgi:dipeptidyl aminopeptidase/acylaminoacyl peptidase
VKVSTSLGGDFDPAYSPDGKYLAWRSQRRAGYESDRFRLLLYDREKRTIWELLPNLQTWVDEFAWGPDSKRLLLVSGQKGEAPIRVANFEGHSNELGDSEELSDLHPLADGRTILASAMKVARPSEVIKLKYSWDYATERGYDIVTNNANVETSPITHLNDALFAQLDLAPLESFWFTAADGIKVEGFLIKPPAFDPAKKYPVKFLIHGGPQGAWGDMWSYRWNAELFAANGYVVVMINPRGSTGYGQAFVDGVNGDWGGKPFTDLMTGLDYAEQHFPFIDKNRECALGASYGGYMANWILGHTDRFKCIVSHDGMFDAESAFGSTEEDWFNQWEFKGNPWDYYGKPDSENPFRKWSPSPSAKNFKTPTLVIHSQLDYRLDVSEGFQLFDTLQLLHVPSKMLYFPDEGHWILKPQNSRLWYKTVNDWVDQWTKEPASSR